MFNLRLYSTLIVGNATLAVLSLLRIPYLCASIYLRCGTSATTSHNSVSRSIISLWMFDKLSKKKTIASRWPMHWVWYVKCQLGDSNC